MPKRFPTISMDMVNPSPPSGNLTIHDITSALADKEMAFNNHVDNGEDSSDDESIADSMFSIGAASAYSTGTVLLGNSFNNEQDLLDDLYTDSEDEATQMESSDEETEEDDLNGKRPLDVSRINEEFIHYQEDLDLEIHNEDEDNKSVYHQIPKDRINIKLSALAKFAKDKQIEVNEEHCRKIRDKEILYRMNHAVLTKDLELLDPDSYLRETMAFTETMLDQDFPWQTNICPFIFDVDKCMEVFNKHIFKVQKKLTPKKAKAKCRPNGPNNNLTMNKNTNLKGKGTTTTIITKTKEPTTAVTEKPTMNEQQEEVSTRVRKQVIPPVSRNNIKPQPKTSVSPATEFRRSQDAAALLTKLPPSISVSRVAERVSGIKTALPDYISIDDATTKRQPGFSISRTNFVTPAPKQQRALNSNLTNAKVTPVRSLANNSNPITVSAQFAAQKFTISTRPILAKPQLKAISNQGAAARFRFSTSSLNSTPSNATPTRFAPVSIRLISQESSSDDSVPKIVNVSSQANNSRVSALKAQLDAPPSTLFLPRPKTVKPKSPGSGQNFATTTNTAIRNIRPVSISIVRPSQFQSNNPTTINFTPIRPKPQAPSSLKPPAFQITSSPFRNHSQIFNGINNNNKPILPKLKNSTFTSATSTPSPLSNRNVTAAAANSSSTSLPVSFLTARKSTPPRIIQQQREINTGPISISISPLQQQQHQNTGTAANITPRIISVTGGIQTQQIPNSISISTNNTNTSITSLASSIIIIPTTTQKQATATVQVQSQPVMTNHVISGTGPGGLPIQIPITISNFVQNHTPIISSSSNNVVNANNNNNVEVVEEDMDASDSILGL